MPIALWLLHFVEVKDKEFRNLLQKTNENSCVYFFMAEENWQVFNLLNYSFLRSFKKFRIECDSVTFFFCLLFRGENHQTHVNRIKMFLFTIRCSYGYNNIWVIINAQFWLFCTLFLHDHIDALYFLLREEHQLFPFVFETRSSAKSLKGHRGKWEEGFITASSLGIMQCVENNKYL